MLRQLNSYIEGNFHFARAILQSFYLSKTQSRDEGNRKRKCVLYKEKEQPAYYPFSVR